MGWTLAQHNGFKRELSKLEARDAEAIKAALARLREQLERVDSLDPRKVFASGAIARIPDLQSLQATGIPGSYRLRVGRHRVALALLPSEKLILLTVVARRGESTYDALPDLHRKRVLDR